MRSALAMLDEVNSVVYFIAKLLRQRSLESRKVALFEDSLRTVLCTYYMDHWFPETPQKGSAYRCIRNNSTHGIDPLFVKAGIQVGLEKVHLFDLLPNEITMWVDPDNVSYRIGEDGSIGVLFDGRASIVIDQESSRPVKFQSCKDQVLHHLQSSARSGSEAITATAS